jgi:hypothetical protein
MYDYHVTPKTEKELSDLIPEGDYDYEIKKVTNKEKDGFNQMMWNLKLWGKDGKEWYFNDFFKFDESSNFCMRKIRHALVSCGCKDLWEKGSWNNHDLVGKCGKLTMIIQPAGISKKDGKFYQEKNQVKDYISLDGLENAMEQLKERQAIRAQNADPNLPPVNAYDDIPGLN